VSKQRFEGPQRVTLLVDALQRRTIRRQLIASGWKWTEDRGFFDSLFAVDIPDGAVMNWTDDQ
jgi:hypothetical protein